MNPIIEPRGPAAEEIAELWMVLLGVGTAVFILTLALLLGPIVLRNKRQSATDDNVDDQDRSSVDPASARRWILAGGVALPCVILTGVLAMSVATMRDLPQAGPAGGIEIKVTGYQWRWSAEYPNQKFTVANEIHIPVGQPVELTLISADVIHSFWVPELAGKLDALPDGPNTLVIEADEPGEYTGACAEFCGLQHAKMGVLVIAESPQKFADWVELQQSPALTPATAEATRGEQVFLSNGCASCHTVRGTTATGTTGPDLTHFASRRTLAAVTLQNTRENLARWLRDPDSVKEGTAMPDPQLTGGELKAVLAYLEGLE